MLDSNRYVGTQVVGSCCPSDKSYSQSMERGKYGMCPVSKWTLLVLWCIDWKIRFGIIFLWPTILGFRKNHWVIHKPRNAPSLIFFFLISQFRALRRVCWKKCTFGERWGWWQQSRRTPHLIPQIQLDTYQIILNAPEIDLKTGRKKPPQLKVEETPH